MKQLTLFFPHNLMPWAPMDGDTAKIKFPVSVKLRGLTVSKNLSVLAKYTVNSPLHRIKEGLNILVFRTVLLGTVHLEIHCGYHPLTFKLYSTAPAFLMILLGKLSLSHFRKSHQLGFLKITKERKKFTFKSKELYANMLGGDWTIQNIQCYFSMDILDKYSQYTSHFSVLVSISKDWKILKHWKAICAC